MSSRLESDVDSDSLVDAFKLFDKGGRGECLSAMSTEFRGPAPCNLLLSFRH